jgi:hypothetical protein
MENKTSQIFGLPPDSSDQHRSNVGYCKPPREHQFKPGQSGNRHGRPRGSKNKLTSGWLGQIVQQEARRGVSVSDANGLTETSMAEAIVRSLALAAKDGDTRAQKLFINMMDSIDREFRQERDNMLSAAIDYKVEWTRELDRRRRLKGTLPQPIPHPDHVVIDMKSGTIRIIGPMTNEEKQAWDDLQVRAQDSLDTIEALEQLLQREPEHPGKDLMTAEIAEERRIHEDLSRAIAKGIRYECA